MVSKNYVCHCWCEYPNDNHKRKNGKWKCVDSYEYVGKSKYGATHCKKKPTK